MPEDTSLRLLNLPIPLRILNIELQPCDDKPTLQVCLQSISRRAYCPICGRVSRRVHSRYQRTLGDLPLGARQVFLVLAVRRFFCGAKRCPRKIFCERLGEMARTHARRTTRMRQALQHIGMADGGRPGGRLAGSLTMPASRTTLLRLVRTMLPEALPSTTVLGVDDFAFRRGRNYGTLLFDLQKHQVVDLLPDRSAQSLATWLRARPSIRIISRDRGGIYAQGAREGAPQALQVADRWHLVDNLAEALTRFLSQHQSDLRAASVEVVPVIVSPEQTQPSEIAKLSRAELAKQVSRSARVERFETVRRLHTEGHTNKQIAAHMGMGASTVRKFLRAQSFPERGVRRFHSPKLDPFEAFLRQRLLEDCRDGRKLLGELRERGYKGCQSSFYRLLATLREGQHGQIPLEPASQRFSPRHVASVMLKRDRKPEEQSFLERLHAHSPLFRTATTIADGFVGLVRKRTDQAEATLETWVEEATSSCIPSLASFARGLRDDWSAVVAGLTLEWSNGPVEGAVNRLKMIKRQMFGRANFDLLRCRVMSP
jgi:transposase